MQLLCIIIIIISVASSAPIGQNPSITYAPGLPNAFLIFTGFNGLESLFCNDAACHHFSNQTLIPNVEIYSTSLMTIESKKCSKIVNNHTLYCSYYMVIGYGTKSKDMLSFIICYDNLCEIKNMDNIIIDSSTETSYSFGYSTSLNLYKNQQNNEYLPMFTYSKYDATIKQYVLKVIVCLDMFCSTYEGKQSHNPPYIVVGGDAKGEVSIQQTWYDINYNYVSIMYTKLENNKYGLNIAGCALHGQGDSITACNLMIGKELQYKLIFNNQYLSKNYVSMIEYFPSQQTQNVPIMIATYTLNNTKDTGEELWILYCFSLFCDSTKRLSYKLWAGEQINYPLVNVRYEHYAFPYIAFFQDSKDLVFMTCEYTVVEWNCTDLLYNHPTTVIYEDLNNLRTNEMQISVVGNLVSPQQSLMVTSIVQGNSYSGLEFVNCETADCNINERQHIQ